MRETDLLQLADVDLDAFVGAEPDPGFAVEVADQLAFLLKLLPGDDLREVARSCLEEQSLTEIARQRGCSTRTIQRKWSLIVRIWRDHIS